MRTAVLDELHVGGERHDIKQDVFLSDAEVMHHARVGHLDPGRPIDLAALVRGEHEDVIRGEAFRLVAEGDQLAGFGVDLRMSGECLAFQAPAEGVVVVEGLERERIEHHRRTVLLHREELAVMIENLGVGGAAAEFLDARVVGQRIAVHAEERAPRGMLRLPALCADIAAAEVNVAVLDVEHRQMTLAVEGDVVHVLRGLGVLRIGPDAIEDPAQVGRQLALDLAIVEIVLRAIDAVACAPATAERPATGAHAPRRKQHLRARRLEGTQAGDARADQRHRAHERPAVDAAPGGLAHRADRADVAHGAHRGCVRLSTAGLHAGHLGNLS